MSHQWNGIFHGSTCQNSWCVDGASYILTGWPPAPGAMETEGPCTRSLCGESSVSTQRLVSNHILEEQLMKVPYLKHTGEVRTLTSYSA